MFMNACLSNYYNKYLFIICAFFYVYLLYLFIFVLTRVDFSMKNMELSLKKPFDNNANVCLIDSTTTHTILKKFDIFLLLKEANNKC